MTQSSDQMRNDPIVIWGAGAIGGTIGAFLSRAGLPVLLVDAVSQHVEAMNTTGLTISGPVDAFTATVEATIPAQLSGMYQRILLCVKGQDTRAAMDMLIPFLAPDGYVVSVQNGLNEQVIAERIGPERTIGAFINFGSDYLGPGEILYGGRSNVVVGELDGQMTARVQNLCAVLQHFEPNAIATPNIWGYLWSKLAYCSLLFSNALVDAQLDEVIAAEKYRPVHAELVREVIRIAEAKQVKLEAFNPFDPNGFTQDANEADANHAFDLIFEQRQGTAKKHSGMWRDIAIRKRRTELDALLLPVVSEARKHGIQTPLNDRLIELIRDLEEGRRSQSWDNLEELKTRLLQRRARAGRPGPEG